MNAVKSLARRVREFFLRDLVKQNQALYDITVHNLRRERIKNPKNPLNQYGAKYFSQADEDGLTLEILRRIGIDKGTFVEFGVGTGLENNTLILLASGWKGIWVGNEELSFECDNKWRKFVYLKTWVMRENIVALVSEGLSKINSREVDVLSLDLDMNDIYFAEELLKSGMRPKLFIAEYNAKFPPPIRWQVSYDGTREWKKDDYQGASLQTFYDLFSRYNYTLVCCNAHTGVNAFFVLQDYVDKFQDVPTNINDLFYGAAIYLSNKNGHPSSPKTVERMVQLNEEVPD